MDIEYKGIKTFIPKNKYETNYIFRERCKIILENLKTNDKTVNIEKKVCEKIYGCSY